MAKGRARLYCLGPHCDNPRARTSKSKPAPIDNGPQACVHSVSVRLPQRFIRTRGKQWRLWRVSRGDGFCIGVY